MAITSWTLWAIIALLSYTVYHLSNRKNQHKLPPGPKPIPILGNITDFPRDGTPEYQHWLKLKDMYGGIFSVTVLGNTLVIIHDKVAAHELLERTAGRTSGRPPMVMANELCGFEPFVVCQDYYNPSFRRYRKFLHRELGTKVSAAQFRDVQEIEVNRQLVRGLKEPGKWLEHIRTYVYCCSPY